MDTKKTLQQLLGSGAPEKKRAMGRVGYFSSVLIASVLLIAGLLVYNQARLSDEVLVRGGWRDVFPMVAMAYGSLLLLAVAVIEIRVRHVRADSLVLRTLTLDELVSHLTQEQEREREQISIRLHDDLGGTLTALKLEIEMLSRNRLAAQAGWAQVNQLLDSLFAEVRGLSSLLYPRLIGTIGLQSALEELTVRLSSRKQVIHTELSGPLNALDETLSLCVLRVIQEAIVNARRHAEANLVQVSLHCDKRQVHGAVDDNGKGLNQALEGMGMTLMRERVRKLGGQLDIEKSAKGGVCVRFQIPCATRNGGATC
jgi:signal transduction histidine kinase